MKHSPAPWLYRGKSCGVYSAPPVGTVHNYGTHYFSFREDEEPNDDDLRLILAAPDLLKALYVALEAVSGDRYATNIIESAIA